LLALPKFGVHFSGPSSAINDKTAATGAKPRPIKFDHYVCRIRRLGLLAKQVTSPVHSQMEIIEMLTWPNSITRQLCGWAGKHTVHLLEGET
jgi:hypothetical protein